PVKRNRAELRVARSNWECNPTSSDPPGRAPGLISRGWIPQVSHIQGELPILGCARHPTPRRPPMRALTIIAVLLAGGAASLCAQHGGDIEIGGEGSHTRYGSGPPHDNQFGAGGRRRLFLGAHLRAEVYGRHS